MTASKDLSCLWNPSNELSASICQGGDTLFDPPNVASLMALILDAFLAVMPPSHSREFWAADHKAAALSSLRLPDSLSGVSAPYLLADSLRGVFANLESLSCT